MTEDEVEPMPLELIILALAERFEYDGIPTRQAQHQAFSAIGMAMDRPQEYLEQICEITFH
jgi:hypothetical protein